MAQRGTIIADRFSSNTPFKRIAEERFWLHRDMFRPVLSGQVDELLIQGENALLFDLKSGHDRMNEPVSNVQLRVYAMLVKVRWPELENITAAVLSPHYTYTPHCFNAVELEAIRDEILATLATLDFQAAPLPGTHCKFCPAAMVCPARRQETAALAVPIKELPTGLDAAQFLETVMRVEAVCEEIKAHYKAQLAANPGCVPGWRLQSSIQHWIPHPHQALERLIEQFSVSDFLDCCTVKLAELETAWAKKNNLGGAQAKAGFDRLMEGVMLSKRTAPSLKAI